MTDTILEIPRNPSIREQRAKESVLSNRDLDDVLWHFRIELSDLGDKVLDLGSGASELFARQAAEHGIQVFSVNPKLVDKKNLEDRTDKIENTTGILSQKGDLHKSVAAYAQALPFKDDEFPTVVSLYAVPLWLPEEEYLQAFKEVYRVLSPGGKAFLGPVDGERTNIAIKQLQELGLPFKAVEGRRSEQNRLKGSQFNLNQVDIVIEKPLQEKNPLSGTS